MRKDKLINEVNEIENKLRNVTFNRNKLGSGKYFKYGNQWCIKKDSNKVGRRKYTMYSNLYFHNLHIKSIINNDSEDTNNCGDTDTASSIYNFKRTDFKVGDKVINKSRNNAIYVLDLVDLIRFKGEELVLTN